MIPTANIIAFTIALMFTGFLPVALAIFLLATKRITVLPFILGVLAFFVSQMVLRLPLMSLLATQGWYQRFATMFIPFVLVTALTAGLFEESARLGGALILKKQRTYRDIVSFGLGHGLCEVVMIVGLTHVNNILFSLAINSGEPNTITNALPPATLEAVTHQLAAAGLLAVSFGVLERVGAVLFHIFATFLIFRGVIVHQKALYWVLAVLTHAAVNAIALFTFHAAGAGVSVALILALGLLMGWYVWRQRNNSTFQPHELLLPQGEAQWQ